MKYEELLDDWKSFVEDNADEMFDEENDDSGLSIYDYDYVDGDFRSVPDRNYGSVRVNFLDSEQWRKLEQYFMQEIDDYNYDELLLQFLEEKIDEIELPDGADW